MHFKFTHLFIFSFVLHLIIAAPGKQLYESLEEEVNLIITSNSSVNREKRNVYQGVIKPLTKSTELLKPTLTFLSIKLSEMWKGLHDLFKKNVASDSSVDKIMKSKVSFVKIMDPKREKPTFALESVVRDERSLSRQKRAGPLLTAFIPAASKIAGWTAGMAFAGAVASVAGAVAADALAAKRENERLERSSIDCSKDHVGCIEGNCWSNCGPRVHSSDWCFTTKTYPKQKNEKIQIAQCKTDRDCEVCWPCASTCYMDDISKTEISKLNNSKK